VGTIITQPAPDLSESGILSVSGAGDCFNAGFISGILQGLTWTECAIKGTFCAKKSLQSVHNVPEHF
jgi:sugar/nucleoside kinase (ribokinase family)